MHWSNLIYLVIPSVVLLQQTDASKVASTRQLVTIESTKKEVGHHLYKRMDDGPRWSPSSDRNPPPHQRISAEGNTNDSYRNFRRRAFMFGNGLFILAEALGGLIHACAMVFILALCFSVRIRNKSFMIQITALGQFFAGVFFGVCAGYFFRDLKKRWSTFGEDATNFARGIASRPMLPSRVAGNIEMGRLALPVLPTRESRPLSLHTSKYYPYRPGSHFLGSSTNSNGAGC
ncbi:hypothetical protein SeLEV6574_g02281 [Synchytrium endobioticum]|uniref:Uncharacterized protein n=1 Tax=Synchytrium endobioticum TaxID=286115 RepID=A0A507C696_9FUNG|nr:hypothetical protein SeLEV6574_g08263 [Synchytrium endobioticum]TPX48046.1 hypothetical protein SeLEV6574_g02281 [Synchytrium endobioticum]